MSPRRLTLPRSATSAFTPEAGSPDAHGAAGAPGKHGAPAAARCTNCDARLHGPYCGTCGEKQPDHHDWTLAGLVHEALHAFTHVDGTLWRTLRTLVARPGMLTVDYFAGRKSRYLRPFALFIVVNLLFFVIQPRTGLMSWRHDSYARVDAQFRRMEAHRAELTVTPAEYRTRFDAALDAKKRSMLLVQIPLFALAVGAVQFRRRRPLAQHAVFAIHTYAFFMLYLGVFLVGVVFSMALLGDVLRAVGLSGVGQAIAGAGRWLGGQQGVGVVLSGGLAAWLALALRRVYGDGRVASVVGAALLVGGIAWMIILAPRTLFELVLRTM